VVAGVALVGFGAWVVGLALSDRTMLTQYLAWIPTLVAAGGLLLACVVVGLLDRKWRRGRGALAAATALCAGWLLAIEHRALAWIWRETPGGEGLRLVYWNLASNASTPDRLMEAAAAPDLLVVANGSSLRGSLDGQGFIWNQRMGIFRIWSRFAVIEHGWTDLGMRGVRFLSDPARDGDEAYDSGQAAYIVLDVSPREPVCVWIIDLPSDIRISRAWMAAEARRVIDGYERADGERGFPAPDVILGDFNIPRGARSLRTLVGPLREASTRMGPMRVRASWPREFPLWHIDQCFVSERLKVHGYRLPDPGAGTHRALVVDVVGE